MNHTHMKNHIPTEAELEALRRQYPVGTRIRLTKMCEEQQPVPEGTTGTVTDIDDIGTIHMAWDNHSSLGLIENVDKFSIIDQKGDKK